MPELRQDALGRRADRDRPPAPGAELAELMAAATELSGAKEHVVRALRNARGAGASHRWGRARASAARPHNSASAGKGRGNNQLPSLYRGRRLPRGIACLLSSGPEPRREEVSFRG